MQCPECGAVISEADLFCAECGTVLATPLSELEGQVSPAEARQPPPQAAPAEAETVTQRDQRATIALILGIFSLGSIVLSCVPLVSMIACGGPLVAIAAIILGAVVRRDIDARGGLAEDRKKAQLGMFMGIGGLALYAISVVVGLVLGVGVSLLQMY